ncbi:MAG: carboxymuconolactone decarboxylase family protein [Pseudomonadota bacterium]
MNHRININQVQPKAFEAMFGIEDYLAQSELDQSLKELIKVRASQINGCAYCIAMHTQAALKNGETHERLFALSAWKESNLFSDKERAVLSLTDEVTQIALSGLSESAYQSALSTLGDEQLAAAIMQVVAINAWNRIAVATKMA